MVVLKKWSRNFLGIHMMQKTVNGNQVYKSLQLINLTTYHTFVEGLSSEVEGPLKILWAIGLILLSGPIELFLIPATTLQRLRYVLSCLEWCT